MPLSGITDPADRVVLTTVAKIMLCIRMPVEPLPNWTLDQDDEAYVLSVPFPPRTTFDAGHLRAVEQANVVRVLRVWVQPEAGRVLLCARVRNSTAPYTITVEEVRIIQRRIEDPRARRVVDYVDDDGGGDAHDVAYSNGPRKRMRVGGDTGVLSYLTGGMLGGRR